MAKIYQYFEKLEQIGASDLHLSVGLKPMARVNGQLLPLRDTPLAGEELESMLREITPPRLWEQYLALGDVDFLHEIEGGRGRVRANLLRQLRGMGAVFRFIKHRIPSLIDLGLPAKVLHFTRITKGLVLITGPTGCGKTTTLAAMLNEINSTRSCHIITIEDPIEFIHENKLSLFVHREVGPHTPTFADALRAAVREDPDVIMVGELRDLETIELALLCAEMGFLVYSTLHTNSAPDTIDRIVDVFPSGEQEQVRVMLAESLAGIVSQQLLKRVDGQGGRIPVVEILLGSPGLANLIREGKTVQIPSMMQGGRSQGMITMDQAMLELLEAGVLDPWEAVEIAVDKSQFWRFISAEDERTQKLSSLLR